MGNKWLITLLLLSMTLVRVDADDGRTARQAFIVRVPPKVSVQHSEAFGSVRLRVESNVNLMVQLSRSAGRAEFTSRKPHRARTYFTSRQVPKTFVIEPASQGSEGLLTLTIVPLD